MTNQYRVYKLSGYTGRIVKADVVEAADDVEAMQKAEEDLDCPQCEVWDRARKVGSIE